jgi:transposase-like protein
MKIEAVILMVQINVVCPHCGSENVALYGKTKNGTQRLLCQNPECSHKTFQLDYSYNACKPGVKQKIIDMVQNGSGTRDIGRVLHISKDTVTSVLKKRKTFLNKSTKTTLKNSNQKNRLT